MSSCWTRRHFFLSDKKKCLLAEQEDRSSSWTQRHTRRHVFLSNKKTCLLIGQEDTSICWTRRYVFLYRKTCLLVEQEDMSSCWTRRRDFLVDKKTCMIVQLEDMSACSTRRHVGLPNKKKCLLVQQEIMSSHPRRRHVFFFFFLCSKRKHPISIQETPWRQPGGQRQLGDTICCFIYLFPAKVMQRVPLCRRKGRDHHCYRACAQDFAAAAAGGK